VRSDRRQSEFEQLPGIGPVTAQVIGAFRFERGTFSSVDQLLHLRRAEDRRGELVPPVPGHEHAARVVDPQLSTGRLIVLNFDGTSGLTCRFTRWDDCCCWPLTSVLRTVCGLVSNTPSCDILPFA
jgi:hypothetical protein